MTGESTGEKMTGESTGEKRKGESAGEKMKGESAGEKMTGESAGEKRLGEAAAEKMTGESAGERKTGKSAGEKKAGEWAGKKMTGKSVGEKKTVKLAGEKKATELTGGKTTDESAGKKMTDESTGEKRKGESAGEKMKGESGGEKKTGESAGEKRTDESTGKKRTGKSTGKRKTGKFAGEKKAGKRAGEKMADKSAGERKTGKSAGERKAGEWAGERKTVKPAGEKKADEWAGEKMAGNSAGKKKAGEWAGEKTTGKRAGERKTVKPAGEKMTGKSTAEKMAGDSGGEKPNGTTPVAATNMTESTSIDEAVADKLSTKIGRNHTSFSTHNNHLERDCRTNDTQQSRGKPCQTTRGTSQAPDTNHSGHTGDAAESIEDKREKINWPNASERKAYADFEKSVIESMKKSDQDCRTIEEELSQLAGTIYCVGESLFGKMTNGAPRRGGPSRAIRKMQGLRKQKRKLRREWEGADSAAKEVLHTQRRELMKTIRDEARRERRRSRKKEKRRCKQEFLKNPYKFAKGLFEEAKSGKLVCTKEELEESLRNTYSDPFKNTPLDHMAGIPRPTEPGHPFRLGDYTLEEVKNFIKKARAKSAPGQDGVPYKVYKRCPKLVGWLFLILKRSWKQKHISQRWARTEGLYMPKEPDSTTIAQCRPISLGNTDGKIFLGVLAKRVLMSLTSNGYIDETVQKACIPGSPGCIEHAAMIWDEIQEAKRERKDLSVIWLDLANAFGSVPHRFLEYTMEHFWIPAEVTRLMMSYYGKFVMRFSTDTFTTECQRLEVGIAAGCTISPIWFILSMELLLRGSDCEGVSKQIRAPKKAFMDDITILTRRKDMMMKILQRLDELVSWAGMKFKAKKSRSLSFAKGRQIEAKFEIAGETMPTVKENPVKSLGRLYHGTLNDRSEGKVIQALAEDGLGKIEKTLLPGVFKIWCLQFVLIMKLLWPLAVYEVAITRVNTIQQKIKIKLRKWLGLPKMFATAGLYRNASPLQLPFPSIVDLYKFGKIRHVLTFKESSDINIRYSPPVVRTGRKWKAEEETEDIIGELRHSDIVGHTQTSRSGLGTSDFQPFSCMNRKERRKEIISRAKKNEENSRHDQLVQFAQQGQCTAWEEEVEGREVKWSHLWKWKSYRTSFLIKCTFDMMPSPANLFKWRISRDDRCACGGKGTLFHILVNCPLGLPKRYTWRHNQVLKVVSDAVRVKLDEINSGSRPQIPDRSQPIRFHSEGQPAKARAAKTTDDPLWSGHWRMEVDLAGEGYKLPVETGETQRPDLVVYCTERRKLKYFELTVCWESGMEAARIRKECRYASIVKRCEEQGWQVDCLPFEVGARGFVGNRMRSLIQQLGMSKLETRSLIGRIQETVEDASRFIWNKRQDVAQ